MRGWEEGKREAMWKYKKSDMEERLRGSKKSRKIFPHLVEKEKKKAGKEKKAEYHRQNREPLHQALGKLGKTRKTNQVSRSEAVRISLETKGKKKTC